MINSMQIAIIKKDIKGIAANRNLLIITLILPFVMAVVLPSVFILIGGYIPIDSPNFKQLLQLFPKEMLGSNIRKNIIQLIFAQTLPLFFLLIPIITAMVMSASAFVGEKEKQTLETLLYSPLSITQIFIAKIIAALVFSQCVSFISFFIMTFVVEIESKLIIGSFLPMNIYWAVLMLLLSPAVSLMAISMIVRTSAKSKSVEEAQQRSVFVILPVIILIAGQFSGVVLLNIWVLIIISVICVIIGLIILQRSSSKFSYERLLL